MAVLQPRCPPDAPTLRYPAALRSAIDECPTRALVYLVRRNRVRPELNAVEHSATIAPDAHMYLLTWEHLDHVLGSGTEAIWKAELRAYLRKRGLAAFRGFANALPHCSTVPARAWRWRPKVSSYGLATLFSLAQLPLLRQLALRVPPGWSVPLAWANVTSVASLSRLRALARDPLRFSNRERHDDRTT